MANSEDVLERARNSILLVNEANQSLHIHNQQMFGLVCDLAAEIRELRRDRARLIDLFRSFAQKSNADGLHPAANAIEAICDAAVRRAREGGS